jgi:hypothetical protein
MEKSFILLFTVMLFYTTSGQNNAAPEVTGPVTAPGNIFSASLVDLSPFGYIEQEFFIEGKARRYDFDTKPGTVIPVDSLYPYKTRIIVRRPSLSEKFNGTVVVEWLNVSSMYDIDSDWFQLHAHLMRSGYAWVGVSAQGAGIHSPTGLRKWNPARYGSLDVTADSTLLGDQLCFDIYSQAISTLKGEQKARPMGNLNPEIIIATGHSQSALFLTGYYNFIQPLMGLVDGFMIRGAGEKLRTNIPARAFKINAETDLIEIYQAAVRQPDTDRIITWEFAGTSHADQTFLDAHSAICKREFGSYNQKECDQPRCSLIPFYYGFASAIDHMNRWIREDIIPPAGIQITVRQIQPEVILERDTLGNALGGIRLPQFAVPTAMNSGKNEGQDFCKYYGTHKQFDQQTLKTLYPTNQAYMKIFNESVLENLKAGYILKADTSNMLNEARRLSNLWN